MKKKKWRYIVFIVLLIIPILFLYNSFNGNPISMNIAKSTLKHHLLKTYPNENYRIDEQFFSFKDSGYHFTVIQIGDSNLKENEFILSGFLGNTIYYDGIYYANQDGLLIEKLEAEAESELFELLQNAVPEIIKANVQLEILKDKHSFETVWTKDFTPEKPMYIHLTIDTKNLNNEDILQAAEMIQMTLNENGYEYDNVTIDANVFIEKHGKASEEDWYVKYAISFNNKTNMNLKQVKQFE